MLAGWLVGGLVDWLAGWLVGWLVGCMAGWNILSLGDYLGARFHQLSPKSIVLDAGIYRKIIMLLTFPARECPAGSNFHHLGALSLLFERSLLSVPIF